MLSVIIASSVMVYFILIIILVLNIDDKSKIIKYSFLLLLISLLVAFFVTNELFMDYLISIIVRFWYYPTFSTIIAIVFITMVLYIYNIFNDNIPDKRRIINYIYGSFIFIGYIIFMLLEVNVNSYNSLYDGDSLLCIRYITRTFILWLVTDLSMRYLHFIKGGK